MIVSSNSKKQSQTYHRKQQCRLQCANRCLRVEKTFCLRKWLCWRLSNQAERQRTTAKAGGNHLLTTALHFRRVISSRRLIATCCCSAAEEAGRRFFLRRSFDFRLAFRLTFDLSSSFCFDSQRDSRCCLDRFRRRFLVYQSISIIEFILSVHLSTAHRSANRGFAIESCLFEQVIKSCRSERFAMQKAIS